MKLSNIKKYSFVIMLVFMFSYISADSDSNYSLLKSDIQLKIDSLNKDSISYEEIKEIHSIISNIDERIKDIDSGKIR